MINAVINLFYTKPVLFISCMHLKAHPTVLTQQIPKQYRHLPYQGYKFSKSIETMMKPRLLGTQKSFKILIQAKLEGYFEKISSFTLKLVDYIKETNKQTKPCPNMT